MGGLRLFLQEPNNNSADPIDSELPGTSPPSVRLPTPLTICRTVSCQNRATLVATRAAAAVAAPSLRQSVRGRRGNQISLGGPASLALYRS